jgi:branched-chain amino acid transport system substrate-binding protein
MAWRRAPARALLLAALAAAALAAVWLLVPERVMVVGFLGPLEGKYSDLGVQGRNGASLALEEANSAGGVAGLTFRLVSRDAANDIERAAGGMRELAQAGAVAVIGPMTSVEAVGAMPEAEAAHLALISPTVSSPSFSGRADCFFRVIADNRRWATELARWCRQKDGHDTVLVVADDDNAAYTRTFREAFRQEFTRLGGRISEELAVHAAREPFLGPVLAAVDRHDPKALVCVLSARDLAALAGALHAAGLSPAIYSAMWAYTRELLAAGGRSLDGTIFVSGYPMDSDAPAYRRFRQDYRRRFGFEPSFAAATGYEAAQVFLAALAAAAGRPDRLLAELARPGVRPGLAGPIPLDANGDCARASFVETVAGGEFRTLERLD